MINRMVIICLKANSCLLFFTFVLEYIVMRGVGRTADAEDTFRINPFLRSTIWLITKMHICVTDTTLQLMRDWENSVALGT